MLNDCGAERAKSRQRVKFSGEISIKEGKLGHGAGGILSSHPIYPVRILGLISRRKFTWLVFLLLTTLGQSMPSRSCTRPTLVCRRLWLVCPVVFASILREMTPQA